MRRIVCAAGGAALAVGLAACSGSDTTSPGSLASLQLTQSDTVYGAVASSGSGTAEDVDILSSTDASFGTFNLAMPGHGVAFAMGRTGGALGSWATAFGCSESGDVFTCGPQTNGGLTLTRTFEFFDANGNPMSVYNDTLTASAKVTFVESGVTTTSDGADTLSIQRNWTATGLLGHETSRTWNGTATRVDGMYRHDSTVTRTYHVTDNTTFTNIVVDLPRSSNPWPVSGTVTRVVNGTGTVTKGTVSKTFTVSRTVTVTFNGTQHVTMMVGSVSYTLDLGTGQATKN